MIFFGHLGLTTAAVKGCEKLVKIGTNRAVPIDYRFVLIGSVLPDLIDKPIGAWLFRSTFHNSRIIGHSLLFVLLITVIGILLLRMKKQPWLLLCGIGSAVHLVFDSMWDYSGTLLWPLFGVKFPERAEGNWMEMSLAALLHNPATYLPELAGLLVLLCFFIKLLAKKQVVQFLKTGRL